MFFHTKVAGVTFEGRQEVIWDLKENKRLLFNGAELILRRDRLNSHDPNAIAVLASDGEQIGFIPRDLAQKMAPNMDKGIIYHATVDSVTGGDAEMNYGVNIRIDCNISQNRSVNQDGLQKSTLNNERSTLDAEKEVNEDDFLSAKQQWQHGNHDESIFRTIVSAANNGIADASFFVYQILLNQPKKRTESEEWLKKAAEQGHSEAELFLGRKKEEEGDYQSALNLYESSAAKNNTLAMVLLGMCYEEGRGVVKDLSFALALYQKAADLGDSWGQGLIGEAYLTGNGFSQDYIQGFKWLEKSAKQRNNSASIHDLGYCYINGLGCDVDIEKAISLLEEAANMGNADSQYMLGLLYSEGQCVKRDHSVSMSWLQKAAFQNHALAIKLLREEEKRDNECKHTINWVSIKQCSFHTNSLWRDEYPNDLWPGSDFKITDYVCPVCNESLLYEKKMQDYSICFQQKVYSSNALRICNDCKEFFATLICNSSEENALFLLSESYRNNFENYIAILKNI